MIQQLVVVFALALAAEAQSAVLQLDTDIALYILYGILGVSTLVCLLLLICIVWFCWKICQLRLARYRKCRDVGDTGKVTRESACSLNSAHSSLSFPMWVNPVYEHCTPPGSVGVSNPKFINSPCKDSLSDLNMDHFRTSVLTTTDEGVESPTSPTAPQSFDHTPLLSKPGNAGNPCSIPAIQVEAEQPNFSSPTSSSLKNDNITRTSISPRSRPKSLDSKHHLTGVNPTRPHSNRLQPLPSQQSCRKDIGPAQASPARSRHAQKYVDQLTASLTPNSRRRYTPAIAKEMHTDTSGVKGLGSSPEQLGMKHLHSDTKETIELEDRKRKEVTYDDAFACLEEAIQSLK